MQKSVQNFVFGTQPMGGKGRSRRDPCVKIHAPLKKFEFSDFFFHRFTPFLFVFSHFLAKNGLFIKKKNS